ncbi:MAG: anti-sigma factor [Acidimicrobiales bacterium]|jgi:anti-sigma factor RsiW
MNHAEITELLGAYALDAVSPEEAAEIEEHLAECPRCRAEVAAHREVAGVLGNLGGSAPAGLWARIADELAIGTAGPLEPAAGKDSPLLGFPTLSSHGEASDLDEDSGGEDEQGDEAGATKAPAPVISIDSARPLRAIGARPPASVRRRSVLFSAVAAAAAALAIVVGVLSTKVVNLDNRVSALSSAIVQGGVKAQVRAAELQPGHVKVSLTGDDSSWSATVVAVPGGQAFLIPGKMPALHAGRTFQAWALVGGKYVSLGVLGRHPGDFPLQLQPGMSSVLVNTEPEGGSPQPTTQPLISGSLPPSL